MICIQFENFIPVVGMISGDRKRVDFSIFSSNQIIVQTFGVRASLPTGSSQKFVNFSMQQVKTVDSVLLLRERWLGSIPHGNCLLSA